MNLLYKDKNSQPLSGFGLYLHYPYCRRVCPFCDFVVQRKSLGTTGLGNDERYFSALARELELAQADFSDHQLVTIYFGGGTPSLAPIALLEKTLKQITTTFSTALQEMTIEVDPSTVTLEKIKALRDLGIERFSLGIQSFNDRLLNTLGRGYDGAAARKLIEMCAQAQIPRLSGDLIFGVAGQTLNDWQADLTSMANHGNIQHLSLYNLMIPADGRYVKRVAKLKQAAPSEEDEVAMHDLAIDYLASCGFEQYEISTWARPGHQAVHNQGYWLGRPYLGLGVSAHSYLQAKRWANSGKLNHYLTQIEQGQRPIAEVEQLTLAQQRHEWWMLRLRRCQGIHRDEMQAQGESVMHPYLPIIERWLASGHLQWQADHLRLSRRGMMVSNEIFSEFCLTDKSTD